MKTPLRLLLVEDSPEDAAFLLRELEERGFAVAARRVATADDLNDALKDTSWDLVIADYTMPGFSGTAALEAVRKNRLHLPFIFVSGTLGEETAVQAMRSGANDYIMKGNLTRLGPAIERELREAKNRSEQGRIERGAGKLEAKVRALEQELATLTRQLASSRAEGSQAGASAGAPLKVRVLIVDDHPENLLALEALLSDLGQDLVKASSGEEALELAYDGDFALILLDVRMPGLNGFETAQLLRKRERTRRIPIIFLTANGDRPDDVQKGYLAGAVDYITKPIVPDVLKAKVNIFLDLYRKEAQLRAKTARLEELNRELETFTYTVSHDLRAPLRGVRGFSQILLKEYGTSLDPDARGLLEKLDDAGIRMQQLIDGLLALSHLTRSEIHIGTLELEGVVNDALGPLAQEIQARGAKVDVDRPLPRVRGHGLTLTQGIQNLVSNALKFTVPGVSPRIRIRAERHGQAIRIWVEDNGIGVAPGHHAKIFGVFERLHPQSEYAGSGLGLSIVKKGMERMGGRCGVESALGQGSRFWLELPSA